MISVIKDGIINAVIRQGTLLNLPKWWKVDGVSESDIVAAYQFVDAKDETTALKNIINPATHLLTKYGSVNWNPATGITGEGGHIRSDIVASKDYTYIVKFKNAQSGLPVIFGAGSNNIVKANIHLSPSFSQYNQSDIEFGGSLSSPNYTGITNGVVAFCNQKIYINGVDTNLSWPDWVDAPFLAIYLLAQNSLSGAAAKLSTASIEYFIIYNKKITPTQVISISNNLERKYPTTSKNLNYSIISSSNLTATSPFNGRPGVVNINGISILVYHRGTSHTANNGALHIKFSNNRGETWSDDDKYIDGRSIVGFPMTLSTGYSGESVIMETPDGNIIIHACFQNAGNINYGTWQSKSTDGGLSWSTPVQIAITGTTADDSIYSTDDYFNYDGVMYVGARQWDAIVPTKGKGCLIKSVDNGSTWDYVADIGTFTSLSGKGASEVGIEYLGNNRIIAVLRDYNNTGTYQSFSTDMGLTWSTPYAIAIVTSGRHRIFTKAHLMEESNWWNDTTLIMIGFIWGRKHAIWQSTDSGLTWSNHFLLDTTNGEGGYADLMKVDSETILCIGYHGVNANNCAIKKYKIKIS